MSNSTADKASDEIDLSDIFSLFKRWIYWGLALMFKAIDFLFKFWWLVLLLIAAGVVVGLFTTSAPSYKASLIVKTNYDSQAYTYNAIEQLNTKIKDGDGTYISENGLAGKDEGIILAEITPIVDVVTLLNEISNSDSRSLSSVLKELSVSDDGDVELFASDRFYSNYNYHKLDIALIGQEKSYVNALLDYINNQPQILKIKEGYLANLDERIADNTKTIDQIDVLIKNYADNMSVVAKNASKLTYYNNQNNININGALDLKNKLIIESEELKNDRITATDALVIISDVQIVKDISFKDKKHLYYPVILVFLFLLIAAVRYAYTSMRKRLVQENLLD